MHSKVIINDLGNLPHREGQTVLRAEREDFEVTVVRRASVYVVYGVVRQPSGGAWTRLASERSTVQQARDLAAEAWRDGENFRTIIGGR